MGLVTGLFLGPAQALALPAAPGVRTVWAAAVPLLWALGWTVTTSIGVAVSERFTVFGSSGAVTVSILLALLLQRLVPVPALLTTRS